MKFKLIALGVFAYVANSLLQQKQQATAAAPANPQPAQEKTIKNDSYNYVESTKKMEKQALSVRNNNPLNIRYNKHNDWRGQVGENKGFSVFIDIEHGFRAAYKLMMTYANKYKAYSIAEIVTRWSPPTENNTQKYIDFVASKLNKSPYMPLSNNDYPLLIKAMADMEGKNSYTLQDVKNGIALA